MGSSWLFNVGLKRTFEKLQICFFGTFTLIVTGSLCTHGLFTVVCLNSFFLINTSMKSA